MLVSYRQNRPARGRSLPHNALWARPPRTGMRTVPGPMDTARVGQHVQAVTEGTATASSGRETGRKPVTSGSGRRDRCPR